MTVRKNLPLSGNRLTDWIFKRLIYLLEKKVQFIFRTKGALRMPDNKRVFLWGYYHSVNDSNKIVIFIGGGHKTRDEMGKTLVHELSHLFFFVGERQILQIESILWNSFTQEQRNLIKSYIPRHSVKKQPEN